MPRRRQQPVAHVALRKDGEKLLQSAKLIIISRAVSEDSLRRLHHTWPSKGRKHSAPQDRHPQSFRARSHEMSPHLEIARFESATAKKSLKTVRFAGYSNDTTVVSGTRSATPRGHHDPRMRHLSPRQQQRCHKVVFLNGNRESDIENDGAIDTAEEAEEISKSTEAVLKKRTLPPKVVFIWPSKVDDTGGWQPEAASLGARVLPAHHVNDLSLRGSRPVRTAIRQQPRPSRPENKEQINTSVPASRENNRTRRIDPIFRNNAQAGPSDPKRYDRLREAAEAESRRRGQRNRNASQQPVTTDNKKQSEKPDIQEKKKTSYERKTLKREPSIAARTNTITATSGVIDPELLEPRNGCSTQSSEARSTIASIQDQSQPILPRLPLMEGDFGKLLNEAISITLERRGWSDQATTSSPVLSVSTYSADSLSHRNQIMCNANQVQQRQACEDQRLNAKIRSTMIEIEDLQAQYKTLTRVGTGWTWWPRRKINHQRQVQETNEQASPRTSSIHRGQPAPLPHRLYSLLPSLYSYHPVTLMSPTPSSLPAPAPIPTSINDDLDSIFTLISAAQRRGMAIEIAPGSGIIMQHGVSQEEIRTLRLELERKARTDNRIVEELV